MLNNELNNQYFNYMYQLVYDCKLCRGLSYIKILKYLHSVPFTYLLPMDGNRYEDGVNLRYRFGHEYDIPQPEIAAHLDIKDCSVLEMMVALSIRCEEHIMDNPDVGNRTAKWFWEMLNNLGLKYMSDNRYDEIQAFHIIRNFLNRNYQSNGVGGLFVVNNNNNNKRQYDLTRVEIWYQMCWYLEENYSN